MRMRKEIKEEKEEEVKGQRKMRTTQRNREEREPLGFCHDHEARESQSAKERSLMLFSKYY